MQKDGYIHTPKEEKDESIRQTQERKAIVRKQREEDKERLRKYDEDIKDIVESNRLRFVHVRILTPVALTEGLTPSTIKVKWEVSSHGGMTLAYIVDYHGVIHYAFGHCSLDDQFCKAKGRYYAAEDYANGYHYTMPRISGEKPGATLYRTYFPAVQPKHFVEIG